MGNGSIHKGHRERLKQRFRQDGLDSFTDIQALELLLFYAIPQKDTNPIAHGLLERFGSLAGVLEAKEEELKKVPGISDHSAMLLQLIPQMARFYQVDKAKQSVYLTTLDACGTYISSFFFGRAFETVFLLCLDAKCKVLRCEEVGAGGVNTTIVSIRKVVEVALGANATTAILAHNHPSGMAIPSEEDVRTTILAARALHAVEIQLADHIVVADGDYLSMVQSGYITKEQLRG